MSFALTADQILHRTKTVTRRLGWVMLKPGTLLQPVVKVRGLPKGGKVQTIGGPIRVVSVRQESLSAITPADVVREGFPAMTVADFVEFFCKANGLAIPKQVTRIEFEYVDEAKR